MYNTALVFAFAGCILFGARGLYNCYKALKAITQQRQSLQPVLIESAIALCYTLGATLFLVADSMHLFPWKSPHDRALLYRATGYTCVLGSTFFLGAALAECGRTILPADKKRYLHDPYLQHSV